MQLEPEWGGQTLNHCQISPQRESKPLTFDVKVGLEKTIVESGKHVAHQSLLWKHWPGVPLSWSRGGGEQEDWQSHQSRKQSPSAELRKMWLWGCLGLHGWGPWVSPELQLVFFWPQKWWVCPQHTHGQYFLFGLAFLGNPQPEGSLCRRSNIFSLPPMSCCQKRDGEKREFYHWFCLSFCWEFIYH